MKKIITAILLTTTAIISNAETLTPDTTIVKVEETVKRSQQMFVNEPLSATAIEFQKKSIESIKTKYFENNHYPKEELQSLYISFISLALNDAADYVYNNKNVKIDVNEYNENGFTPLMAAAMAPIKGGNVEYAKKLIDLGADMNKGSKKTEISPLSVAANVNNYKVLSLLIFNGALFMKADKLEYRPIDYATKNNSLESALILREALAFKLKDFNKK
jgi:ankyrin repeat protein